MAGKKKANVKRPIESYAHKDKQRVNNPPVGLVTPDTDPDAVAMETSKWFDAPIMAAGAASSYERFNILAAP